MPPRMIHALSIVSMVWQLSGFAAQAADQKPRLPATAQPAPTAAPAVPKGGAPKPVDGSKPVAIGPNAVQFNPPDGWLDSPVNRRPVRELYFAPTRNALISVEVLPANAAADRDVAAAMVRTLKQNRKAAKQTFVQEPQIENDDRFAVRIREKFMDGDKVADQLHLYRMIGKRVLLVTVKTVAEGDAGAAHHALAETVALSAAPVGK